MSHTFEVHGSVIDVKKTLIPTNYIAEIESTDGKLRIYIDLLEDLYMLNKGDRVVVTVSRELPSYREGVDFVARGKVFSIREKGGEGKMLISMGGLILKIIYKDPKLKPPFDMLDQVFVRVTRE